MSDETQLYFTQIKNIQVSAKFDSNLKWIGIFNQTILLQSDKTFLYSMIGKKRCNETLEFYWFENAINATPIAAASIALEELIDKDNRTHSVTIFDAFDASQNLGVLTFDCTMKND